ncbi:MAG: DUF3794 domain-containing protein [Clostridia bacterium]|nr:DUF3794 domain-containing protein [Clostridia bacterium]
MSLELVKEAIKLNRVVGEDSAQTIVENDIIVPDINPDIGRILLFDGEVVVNRTETAKDRVTVDGTILYKILYLSDPDQLVKSVNTSSNFSYDLDIQNAGSGMRSTAKCEIEHINFNILNGRKVNAKVILRISGKVTEEAEYGIISDLNGEGEVQVLRDNILINAYIGSSDALITVSDKLEIPAGKPTIREILRNDVKIAEKDFKLADDKLVVKGEINISTLYIGDDEERSLQYMEGGIPFSQSFDLPGIQEDSMCEVEFRIEDARFEAVEDSDGELRVLSGDVILNIAAEGSVRKSVEILSDAYYPGTRLNLEKEVLKTEEIVGENKGQVILKDLIILDNESPEVSEIFNVLAKPGIAECKVYEDKIVVEGLVNNNILYLTGNNEQPVYCYNQELPFKHDIDIKGVKANMLPKMALEIEHCSYSMVSANQVEIRLVIGVDVKVINQVTHPLVVKVQELPLEDRKLLYQPSITIYFTQPDDNLWKIAKKYGTTTEDIKRVNALSDHDTILPGQQIIIPRKN